MKYGSCIIASIARLIYAVGYDVGNGTSDWEANFNSEYLHIQWLQAIIFA